MMLIVIVCLANFLELPVVQSENGAHYDDPKNDTMPKNAILPGQLYEIPNVRNRRDTKMSAGRQVVVSAADIESMKNVPLSAISPTLPEIQRQILDLHDEYRRKTDPPSCNMLKMVWNEKARKNAEIVASQCKVGHSDVSMRNTDNYKCGENIYYAFDKVPWRAVIAAWFSEGPDFVYGKGPVDINKEVGHFTQLMWATSHDMGCAVAECNNPLFKYIFVCHMCPAGNKGDKLHPWKSGTPCGDCPNSCQNNLCTNPCQYQDWYNDCPSYRTGPTCGSDASLKHDCPAMCLCTDGQIK
ncbi:cysteine-rich venom protein-like [Pseudophryne corroboree]|uniref:cysteine-rich venom protein-like n=1 Tax=Pseudophryne corroboree TaxID=495146 RepID=UPI003081FEF8